MRTVSVQASVNYDVLIGEGLVSQVGEHLAKLRKPCTAAIVTDTTVDALFGDTVEASLKAAGFRTIRHAFPAGEQNKTLETLSDILEDLAEQ
ncbi:MAG: 3-dehydroquinate synthase, partial [Clostridia bacterium]|nr:3-dehydroquinate synthase [Clostridia bacterium]